MINAPRLAQLRAAQVEALVCDDTRRADILVTAGAQRVIVEADGPLHFVRDALGTIVCEDGSTQLRNHLLRSAGYEVLVCRVEDMSPIDFRTPEFLGWLRTGLQQRGLPCNGHAGIRSSAAPPRASLPRSVSDVSATETDCRA
jgi:hypothetical protein